MSLNSSVAFRDLRLGGCLPGRSWQAPARAQSPTCNTRIKRRNFRRSFWGYFDVRESESEVSTSDKGRARLALYSSVAYLRLLNPVKHCENQRDEKIKGTAFAALPVKAKAQSSSAGSTSASGGSGSSSTGASSFLSIAYLEAQKAQLPNALASLNLRFELHLSYCILYAASCI